MWRLSIDKKYDEMLLVEGSGFKHYFFRYLAGYYLNRADIVCDSIQMMRTLINTNKSDMDEYTNNRDHYDNNLVYAKQYCNHRMLPKTMAVLIPCYKPHITKLQRMLDSISVQTRKPDQVIVYTSQSKLEDLSHLRLDDNVSLMFTQETCHISKTRNLLLGLTRADIICFCDADDVIHPQKCEFVEKALETSDICLTHLSLDMNDIKDKRYEFKISYMTCPYNDGCHHGNISFNRSVEVSYNESKHSGGEDIDLLIRLFNRGVKGSIIPYPLMYYDHPIDVLVIGKLTGGLGEQLCTVAKTIYEASRLRYEYQFILSDTTNIYKTIMNNVIHKECKDLSNTGTYKEKSLIYYDAREDIDTMIREHPRLILEGRWQSERHFPDMKTELTKFFNIHVNHSKYNTDDCLIMVRMNDLQYYNDAIDKMKEKGINNFYITSDDIEASKKLFPGHHYLEGDVESVFLDSCNFKNFIISNSPLDWFVTYLSNSINVVTPTI